MAKTNNTIKPLLLFCLSVIILISCGCSTVPITGRTQLMMISKVEETNLGNKAAAQFLSGYGNKDKIIKNDDPSINAVSLRQKVGKIYGRLVRSCDLGDEYSWKFIIVDDPNVINAGMLPGGKMIIYTGIINYSKSDDELAGVLSHEMAHAIARHGAERFSQNMLVDMTASALNVALSVLNINL